MTEIVTPPLGDGADDRPHRPHPRARTLWTVTAAGGGLLVGTPPAALAVAIGAWPLALVPVVAGALVGGAYGRAAWQRRTWSLGSSALELRRGVVIHRAASIPYTRIQQIDLERGPVERMIGLSQLVVRTAAATTDGTIHGLAPNDATRIRQRLLEVAGVDDAV